MNNQRGKIAYLDKDITGRSGYTWNPVVGCFPVSAGCDNCWMRETVKRMQHNPKLPEDTRIKMAGAVTHPMLFPERLDEPLRKKTPSMIGVCFMGDLFHEDVPQEFIDSIFTYMTNLAKWHTYLVLTKRPERILDGIWQKSWKNIWLGVSVEDQKTADERIPLLLQIPAAVRWISYEPALGELDLSKGFLVPTGDYEPMLDYLDWVVVGHESGPRRRAGKIEHVEKVVQDCQDAGVPCFVKQISLNGKVEKDISKFPKELQVREIPNALQR